MNTPTKIALLVFVIVMAMLNSGCVKTEQERVNDFLHNHKKPIIVKFNSLQKYADNQHDITLLSADGQILLLEYSHIVLPDTIK